MQLRGITHTKVKDSLKDKFMGRVTKILKSQLDGGKIVKAINTWAAPTLTYSFGIVKWSKTDLEEIERRVRVAMTKHRAHHPRSAVERVTLPRTMGGRGVIDLKNTYYSALHSLRQYFLSKADFPLYRVMIENDVDDVLL
ncbi:hypothetical protein LSTR_LSTR006472 [Laodelphax striatellus]|uniref:Reverse transcriptase domain-containing protein n=1 Tax=Laodelphax striatellus TaxID=195883 RepID=A0A482WX56_LAOST|nr:hypothetical protein LSTR_LSTR006472 [Laodelphax striatellus]